ncbi:pilus assembly protein [Georgenia sp. Z1344]|uniref:pilus assembly protein n=1 Tax=Georgenia sp. Z1344 TaxID=3416706 RepID=UPI003CF2196A
MVAAVLQLALLLHVRNTLIDSASEGARHGALLGSDPADGAARAAELIRAGLADSYADDVTAQVVTADGVSLVQVTVRAPMPVVGLFGPGDGLEVVGHAALEVAP